MPQPTPEESGPPEHSEQARQLADFMGSEEFQSLSLAEKFASLRKFLGPKPPITPEDIQALFQSERGKKLQEFQHSEEYQKLSGRARKESMGRFISEVYDKMPKSAAERKFEEHFRSEEAQQRARAGERATASLQNIRLLSSARDFLRRLGPQLPAELAEIAREEKLDLPDIADLSPRLRGVLKRAGWEEPQPMRDH